MLRALPEPHPQRYARAVRTALFSALLPALACLALACGPKLPPRYVLERDLGPYKFRRYQQVLDVEIGIEGSDAVGHTATYVRGGQQVLVAPVFITVYQRPAGLTETVRQRLRAMPGYTFDIVTVRGEHLFRMRGAGEEGDSWLVWVSGAQLVKLGAPDGQSEIPDELLEAYLERYPSDLDAKGKAKEGSPSRGAAEGAEPAAAAAETHQAQAAEPAPTEGPATR